MAEFRVPNPDMHNVSAIIAIITLCEKRIEKFGDGKITIAAAMTIELPVTISSDALDNTETIRGCVWEKFFAHSVLAQRRYEHWNFLKISFVNKAGSLCWHCNCLNLC